jgi:hypothetical protein
VALLLRPVAHLALVDGATNVILGRRFDNAIRIVAHQAVVSAGQIVRDGWWPSLLTLLTILTFGRSS